MRTCPSLPPPRTAAKGMTLRRVLATPEGVVVGSLLLCFAVLWPVGRYAVDDEWAFLKSLEHLTVEGRLTILQWNPMSLLGHLFWGSLFTGPFGFSFTAARLSMVGTFVLLCLSVAALLRRIGASRRAMLIALFALLFNPLCFFHGFLYVTDVPACAWTCVALLLFAKGLEGDSGLHHWALIAGSAVGAFGLLVRQSGLLVYVAFLAYLLLYERGRLRTCSAVIACFILPAVVLGVFQYWYHYIHGPTIMYVHERQQLVAALSHPHAGRLLLTLFKYGVYLGLFTLPILVAIPLGCWKTMPKPRLTILASLACACGLLVTYLAVHDHLVFPYLPNKLTPFGFLSPNEVIAGDRPVVWGPMLASAVTLLLLLGMIALIAAGLCQRPMPSRHALTVLRLTGLLGMVQLLYLLVTAPIVFDRHLLMLLPTSLILVVGWTGGWNLNRGAPGIVLLCFAVYSVAGTHDVHAFSRAAFEAGESLNARGASPMVIDGGYAFDGWYSFEAWQQERIPRARDSDTWWVRGLFRGIDSRIILSLSPSLNEQPYHESLRPWSMPAPDLRGYHTLETFPYTTWLPPGRHELYVLARDGTFSGAQPIVPLFAP